MSNTLRIGIRYFKSKYCRLYKVVYINGIRFVDITTETKLSYIVSLLHGTRPLGRVNKHILLDHIEYKTGLVGVDVWVNLMKGCTYRRQFYIRLEGGEIVAVSNRRLGIRNTHIELKN